MTTSNIQAYSMAKNLYKNNITTTLCYNGRRRATNHIGYLTAIETDIDCNRTKKGS